MILCPKDTNMKSQKKIKYGWSGNISSEGTLNLDVSFLPDKQKVEQDLLYAILAEAIQGSVKLMEEKGYVSLSELRLMSSREMAEEYGNSRQYWEKLLREGKIPFYQTAAGRISLDLYVEAYITKKEDVDRYTNNIRKVVRQMKESKEAVSILRKTQCPSCKEQTLDYNWNKSAHEANGICRSNNCDFRFMTSIK